MLCHCDMMQCLTFSTWMFKKSRNIFTKMESIFSCKLHSYEENEKHFLKSRKVWDALCNTSFTSNDVLHCVVYFKRCNISSPLITMPTNDLKNIILLPMKKFRPLRATKYCLNQYFIGCNWMNINHLLCSIKRKIRMAFRL